MGYIADIDNPDEHEGWIAMTYPDGKTSSGTSNSEGYYPDGYTYDADAEIVEAPRPFSETSGWLPRCECGWKGIEVPVFATGTDMDQYREPTATMEHLIMYQWRLHIREDVQN